MKLSMDSLEHLAYLARLLPEDSKRLESDLNHITQLFEQISAVNTAHIQPMLHAVEPQQPLRGDVVTEVDQSKALLSLAPVSEANLFLVPTILE